MANQNQTGMLTPEQVQQQMASRNGLNDRLSEQKYGYELGQDTSMTPEVKAKKKSQSITLINIAFIVILAAGIVGSFVDAFDMEKYVKFLEIFAYVWAPLVVAVAGGTSFKNWSEKKYNANGNQSSSSGNDQPPQ